MKRDAETNYRVMSSIKGKGTKIEVYLRVEIRNLGLTGYRLNCKKVKGHPDLVFLKRKLAVFCDGDFWHGYSFDDMQDAIKTNQEFWEAKIKRNMERDKAIDSELEGEGWKVLRFWEHEIMEDPEACAIRVYKAYSSSVR